MSTPKFYMAVTHEADTVKITVASNIGQDAGWGEFSAATLYNILQDMPAGSRSPIEVYINSDGGDVQEALAMYDMLRECPNTTATIKGMCASAATLLALACDKVRMTPSSAFMVHEPRGGVYGTLPEVEARLEYFKAMRSKVYEIYAAKTGLSHEALERILSKDTYLTATQALEGKWVDEILAPSDAEEKNEETPAPVPTPEPGQEPAQKTTGLLSLSRLKALFSRLGGSDLTPELNEEETLNMLQDKLTALSAEAAANKAAAEAAREALREEQQNRADTIAMEVARAMADFTATHELPAPKSDTTPQFSCGSAVELFAARANMAL